MVLPAAGIVFCQLAELMLPMTGRVAAKCVGGCYKWRRRLGTRSGGGGLLQEVSAAATSHAAACDKEIFLSNNFGLVDLHHKFKISATIVLLICINGRIFLLCLFCKVASMDEFFCYQYSVDLHQCIFLLQYF
jgi:hypothetical protein